jgi:hypothetical protein
MLVNWERVLNRLDMTREFTKELSTLSVRLEHSVGTD